ncbi:MAG: prepilin peptidase [Gammaproteobacteria bacterium]
MENIAAISGGVLLGLMVGSFLNVVIYRLPVMLEREWLREAKSMLSGDDAPLSQQDQPEENAETFNLLTPRSRCQSCGKQIAAWNNIPVISWLILRGRCSGCKASISARYPIIELITGLLSGLVVWKFGSGLEVLAVLVFVWSLITLTMIDIDHMFLPDKITLPLLWLGLLMSLAANQAQASPFPTLASAVLGAAAGYLILWSVYWLFKLLTGKEGMGYGDFKLLAALGAWLGISNIPLVILLSAVVGAVVGIVMIVALGRERQIPIPFGPYLAGAGLIALFWGDQIISAYLGMSGL